MKLKFCITVGGEDSLESKFQSVAFKNPHIYHELSKKFMQSLVETFGFTSDDKAAIKGFTAGREANDPLQTEKK